MTKNMQTVGIPQAITLKMPIASAKSEWNDIGKANEIWKKIQNYPRYECSNFGNFRYFHDGEYRKSKFRTNYGGYFMVNLYDDNDGTSKSVLTHRIIALTFLDNPNNYPIINHIDGNKQNNSIKNLEWCDYQHNSRHAFKLGLRKDISGESNYGARLTFEKVEEIRQKYLTGNYTYIELSLEYNMAFVSIKRIVRNESWYNEKYNNEEYDNKVKELRNHNKREKLFKRMRKLTWEQVNEIRLLYTTENITMQELAKKFNTNKTNISVIIRNKIWVDKNYVYTLKERQEKKRKNFILKNNKIDKEIIELIKNLRSQGLKQWEIAGKIGISQTRVSQIILGKNLKTIDK